MKFLDQRDDYVRLLKQIRAIIASFRYTLRTAAVYVNSVAIVLHKLGSLQQVFRIIGRKLNYQGSVFRTGLEHFLPIFLVGGKDSGMEHGCPAKLSSILPRQHPVGQLGLIDHRRNHILRRANTLEPLVAVQFDLGGRGNFSHR